MAVPNLDAMDDDELQRWRRQRPTTIRLACFPEAPKLEGVAAAWQLRAYARDIAFARWHRLRGSIAAAQAFEGAAEHTYRALPEWARW